MSSISQTLSGPSKVRTHTEPSACGSKLGLGSVRGLGKREEAFELRSRDDGDRGTFWVEDDTNKRRDASVLAAGDRGDIETGKGNIVKTVSVSVTAGDASAGRSSPQKKVQGWQNL
jgi:hypothetical protein